MDLLRKTLPLIRAGLAAVALALASVPVSAAEGVELIMVEEDGCMWCAQWNRDVSPEYALTDEGRTAPLRRIDLHAPVPEDLTFDRPVRFTPTFVLVQNGQELSRIEGYPGEDFFWGLLQMMLTKAGLDYGAEG